MVHLPVRQQQVVDFIRQFIERNGFSPTTREIAAAMGISSPNGVVAHLNALEKKGVITRRENMARSVRLVETAARVCPHCGGALPCPTT